MILKASIQMAHERAIRMTRFPSAMVAIAATSMRFIGTVTSIYTKAPQPIPFVINHLYRGELSVINTPRFQAIGSGPRKWWGSGNGDRGSGTGGWGCRRASASRSVTGSWSLVAGWLNSAERLNNAGLWSLETSSVQARPAESSRPACPSRLLSARLPKPTPVGLTPGRVKLLHPAPCFELPAPFPIPPAPKDGGSRDHRPIPDPQSLIPNRQSTQITYPEPYAPYELSYPS